MTAVGSRPLSVVLAAPAALAAALALACATGPACGQAPAAAPAGGKASVMRFGQPGEPIGVSSDGSQVFQNENKVVLTGRVELVQGTSRMRSPRVVMYYNPKNATKDGAATADGAGPGAISRMEADGPVYFVTPTQSAKGDHGVYDAANDTITLTGNVTVIQDDNVATGDKLVIQQKSGLTTLSSGASAGRVKGVFYSKDKPGDKPAAATPKP